MHVHSFAGPKQYPAPDSGRHAEELPDFLVSLLSVHGLGFPESV